MVAGVQRIENLALAGAILIAYVYFGYAWWGLLVMFLIFDVSALGYFKGPRIGALVYNAVHNYTAPALLAGAYLISHMLENPIWLLGFLSGTWAFHVAVDRALGYGLKLAEGFQHTHLGHIGKAES